MSWDIFVQDLPRSITSVKDIPDDFRPQPLGLRRSEIIAAIRELVPDADFSDPAWGRIDHQAFSIEVNLGDCEQVDSFAFHVRGGHEAAVVVSRILQYLDLRALDMQSDSGLFAIGTPPAESMQRWRNYRDQIIGGNDG